MIKTKTFGRYILLTMAMMISMSSYAKTLIDGIYYNLDDKKKEAEVIDRDENGLHFFDYKGKIDIPETVKHNNITYTVTKIQKNCFSNCYHLISISIPSTVTEIGEYAIIECIQLESLTVDKGNKVYDSRNNCNALIYTETNELLVGCKNTKIPVGITRIGDNAFQSINVSTVTIPNTVTSIGKYAFCASYGLGSLNLPNSLEMLENNAFYGSSGLTSIVIPNNITKLEPFTFDGNSDLVSVTLPDNLKTIGNRVFTHCPLENVVIPATVTEIDELAFADCKNLKSISFLSTTPPVLGNDIFLNYDSPNKVIEIHVPKGYKDVYQKDSQFKKHIIIDDLPATSTTIISTQNANYSTSVLYSIEGKRVENPVKGNVYISNGKKVIY